MVTSGKLTEITRTYAMLRNCIKAIPSFVENVSSMN